MKGKIAIRVMGADRNPENLLTEIEVKIKDIIIYDYDANNAKAMVVVDGKTYHATVPYVTRVELKTGKVVPKGVYTRDLRKILWFIPHSWMRVIEGKS